MAKKAVKKPKINVGDSVRIVKDGERFRGMVIDRNVYPEEGNLLLIQLSGGKEEEAEEKTVKKIRSKC